MTVTDGEVAHAVVQTNTTTAVNDAGHSRSFNIILSFRYEEQTRQNLAHMKTNTLNVVAISLLSAFARSTRGQPAAERVLPQLHDSGGM
jgi:hypothetical protein